MTAGSAAPPTPSPQPSTAANTAASTNTKRELPPGVSPVPDPPIRTLRVELLSGPNGQYVPVVPNSREPTPFETDFFKGHAMLMIRTKPIDPHFNNFFEGRKRMFEVQVQGQFKRAPAGEIFVGAEALQKLELGLLTRSISNAAMRLAGTMAADLHYHFGDADSDPQGQKPHVVAPMFTTFDKIIVSKPGETPPPLGIPFTEDLEYRKQRLKFKCIADAEVSLDNVYSFSVNTSNLDLLSWALMGIPMVKPMDLRMFFANSPIQLIAYEMPHSAIAKYPNAHPRHTLSYVFSMRLSPCEPEDSLSWVSPVSVVTELPCVVVSSEEEREDDERERDRQKSEEPKAEIESESSEEDVKEDAEELEGEELGEDDDSLHLQVPGLQSPFQATKKSGPSASALRHWLRRKFTKSSTQAHADAQREGEADAEREAEAAGESGEYVLPDIEMEIQGDLQFCPACIEINDPRTQKRRHVYVLPLSADTVVDPAVEQTVQSVFNVRSPRLRSYSEIAKVLALSNPPKLHKNKRLSALELRRRQVVETVRNALKNPGSTQYNKLQQLLAQVTELDACFLNGNASVVERERKGDKTGEKESVWEGYVALAGSHRHFTEYHMTLSHKGVVFKKHADRKHVKGNFCMEIPLSEIASVQILPPDQCPIKDFFGFLQIETTTRVHVVLVRSDMQLTDWMQGFITLLGNNCMCSRFRADYRDSAVSLSAAPNSAFSLSLDELHLARPLCYSLHKRRVHNYRRVHFRKPAPSSKTPDLSPNAYIARCLATAFSLSQKERTQQATEYDWVQFWDEISLLQVLDLYSLSERERMAFFLCCYEVLLIHASLLYGPPSGASQWHAFFNDLCYVVGRDLVSLHEIEFCILKAAMSHTSMFAPTVGMPHTHSSLPTTSFPGLALTQRDFRLHFAVCNGSLSHIEEVPVYSPDRLDDQLDDVARVAVEQWVDVDAAKKLISMPKLPLADFAIQRTHTGDAKGSNQALLDCLSALTPYMSRPKKTAVLPLLQDLAHVSVKYKALQFKCRFVKQWGSSASSVVPLKNTLASASVSAESETKEA